MYLYSGSSTQFIDDAMQSRIADLLRAAFIKHNHHNPQQGEYQAWQNSLFRLAVSFKNASLTKHGVVLEYQLPPTSMRLDCLITGVDDDNRESAVIIELKQWSQALPSDSPELVITYVGKGLKEVPHPSRQVGNYQQHLKDNHSAFDGDAINLFACSYVHNMQYSPANELFNPRHNLLLKQFPLFVGDQSAQLESFLHKHVGIGDDQRVLSKILKSKFRPTKKLLDHTSAIIKNERVYTLLDDQIVVFNSTLTRVRDGINKNRKTVILAKGGPGTGKSLIALNLVAELSAQNYNVQHATGSRAFTENIRDTVGRRASAQFNYFNNYGALEKNAVDVLILDEAHRIRPNSYNRFTKKAVRKEITQIQELINAAKVTVFFIDDFQVVRPGEVGSTDLIRATAKENNADLFEFELTAQFRCNGSDGYVNWIDHVLGIRETANQVWNSSDPFDFRIMDSVQELEAAIREKHNQDVRSRLVAGFCWKWSNATDQGELVPDVEVGTWSMPWNARPESKRLAKNIPKSHLWASNPHGIDQVGCVYTAQGFDFDYVGIIFGRDLRYDPAQETWVGDAKQSHDKVVKSSKDRFVELVKHTYRVLLTRGLKGCYVYFMDNNTREFFEKHIK